MEAEDIKEILIAYMIHVSECEGTDFLGLIGEKYRINDDMTEKNVDFLNECRDEARSKGGW